MSGRGGIMGSGALRRAALALAAAALLSACGNENAPGGLFSVIGDKVAAQVAGGAPPVDARVELTPARLAAQRNSILLVVVDRTDSGYTVLPIAANLGTIQWIDETGGGLLTRDGVLVGTRGFGFDLLQADVGPIRAALRAGGGTGLVRVEHRLNGAGEPVRERFVCTLSPQGAETLTFFGTAYPTRRYEERCAGDARAPVNRYWLDADGGVRKSVVDLGPVLGTLQLSRIVD